VHLEAEEGVAAEGDAREAAFERSCEQRAGWPLMGIRRPVP
jgi:hypothetical protein